MRTKLNTIRSSRINVGNSRTGLSSINRSRLTGVQGSNPVQDGNFRILEDSDFRITEDGDFRVLE